MIGLVKGNIHLVDEDALTQELLESLFLKERQNDIICVTTKAGDKIYINSEDVKNRRFDGECCEIIRENLFSEIYCNPHIDGVVPVLDPQGNPIALAKYSPSVYNHDYDCDKQRIDTAVFDLYECVCLYGINEYSVLMYQQCLHNYKGEIFLVGDGWNRFLPYLGEEPKFAQVFVTSDQEMLANELLHKKAMHLKIFISNIAHYEERCRLGIFSYDEIMTLVYYFAQHKEIPGQSGQKFYVMDVLCDRMGLVAMANRFDVPCAYVISKGYTPVINLVSSDDSLYSDGEGDDIWSKFFLQPTRISPEDLNHASDITISPLSCITFSGKWLMQQITHCGALDLMKPEYFNDRLLQHIKKYHERFMQEPEKTLGVLIRGTDYTVTRPKGHPVQATPGQVIQKVKELAAAGWDFHNIFVATEDAAALEEMKEAFGNRICYVEQKRFVLTPGEYISDQKGKGSWQAGDGWQYGADYLCAMVLLSECAYFVASGECTGTGFVQKLLEGRPCRSYIFDLGLYE